MGWPRALGHPDRADSISRLAEALRDGGATEVHPVAHAGSDPHSGESYALQSLVAHVRPTAPHRFVLASHFDTRPWAERDPDPSRRDDPVPGANDGTSGVAVLLELMPLLRKQLPADVGFTTILFDGEELGRPDHADGYCVGSRDLARRLAGGEFEPIRRAAFGIVLDMVGDTDLHLRAEHASLQTHPAGVRHIWDTARAAGLNAFETGPGPHVIDDHTFLTRAGVPSILIIDYVYPRWHTTSDTLDGIDPRSLGQVGEAVRRAVTSWPWP